MSISLFSQLFVFFDIFISFIQTKSSVGCSYSLLANYLLFSLLQPILSLPFLSLTRLHLSTPQTISSSFFFLLPISQQALLYCTLVPSSISLQYYCTPGWPVIPFRAHPPPPSIRYRYGTESTVAAVSLLGIIHHTISVTHPPLCFPVQKTSALARIRIQDTRRHHERWHR